MHNLSLSYEDQPPPHDLDKLKALRGHGYGSQLMMAAENLSKDKKCLFATVYTMSFQALEFYKKIGYRVECERRGYLQDAVSYMLRKDF